MGRFDRENSYYDDNRYHNDDNQLKPILMGILFSLGGVVGWIIIGIYVSFFSSIASLSLGFLFCYGFAKYGGEMNKNIRTFLIGYILLLSLLITYIIIGINISMDNNINILEVLIYTIPELLGNNQSFMESFLYNIFSSLIFSLLGIFYILYMIKHGRFGRMR